jgi:hypothetical protein
LTDELLFLVLVMIGSLGVLVGAPAAILIWLRPRWRVAAFFLGVALTAGNYGLFLAGHDRGLPVVLMEHGVGIALAALLVEVPAFVIRTFGRAHQG